MTGAAHGPGNNTLTQDWDVTSSVGLTALGVAAGRATEHARSNGLCSDPYAEPLVRSADPPRPLPTRIGELPEHGWDSNIADVWKAMSIHMGLRTRFLDEYLTGAANAGVRQVVLLAAGLDTRAHRLDWPPQTRVFELDQPKVLDFKDHVLSEQNATVHCHRSTVSVDLREDWSSALLEAGFDRQQRTAWLAEGLLPYLPEDAERALLDDIHALSAPGSQLALNESNNAESQQWDSRLEQLSQYFGIDLSQLWYSKPNRADPATLIDEHGWVVTELSGQDLAQRYDGDLPEPHLDLFARRSRYLHAQLPA